MKYKYKLPIERYVMIQHSFLITINCKGLSVTGKKREAWNDYK